MIRIDSDTHFTPLDAFTDLDPKCADQGPRVGALPTRRYRHRLDTLAARPVGNGLRCSPAARERTKRRPKDCFNNFYFSFGSEDSTLPDVVKCIGSSRLMIGSDYPHPDGTSPNTVSMLQAREGPTQRDVDNLLGGTAAEFFGLKRTCKRCLRLLPSRLNQPTQLAASFDPAVYAIPAVARRRTAAQCYYDAVNVIRGISLTRRA